MASKLQSSYDQLMGQFDKLRTLDRLINNKTKYSDDEKNYMLEMIQEHIDSATDIEEDLLRRLGVAVVDEDVVESNAPVYDLHTRGGTWVDGVDDSPVTESVLVETVADASSNWPLKIVERGKAFSGVLDEDTVTVQVAIEPQLYQGNAGRWSWRTKVFTDPNFRYINVSNFAAKAKDSDGNWYVMVKKTWKTKQPVFKDLCNK